MHNSTEKWCRFLFWSDRLTKWNKAPKHRNYCFLKPYWSDDDSSISMQGFFTQSSPNLSSNPQPLLACRKGQTHLPHITAQHLIDQLVQIDFLASNMGRWQPMKFKNCWWLTQKVPNSDLKPSKLEGAQRHLNPLKNHLKHWYRIKIANRLPTESAHTYISDVVHV